MKYIPKLSIPHQEIQKIITFTLQENATIEEITNLFVIEEITNLFVLCAVRYWEGIKIPEKQLKAYMKKTVEDLFYCYHKIPKQEDFLFIEIKE